MARSGLLRDRLRGQPAEGVLDLFQEMSLVFLNRQNIVGPLVGDPLGQRALTADGVDGHEGPCRRCLPLPRR